MHQHSRLESFCVIVAPGFRGDQRSHKGSWHGTFLARSGDGGVPGHFDRLHQFLFAHCEHRSSVPLNGTVKKTFSGSPPWRSTWSTMNPATASWNSVSER